MAIFQLRMGKVFPIFLSIHPLFRFNFSLLISIRNIVLPDEIQKQGLQEATLHLCPLGCLRNRQADRPRINMARPKD
jgi:hypothetical protein